MGRVQHSSQNKETLPAVPPRTPGKDGGCPQKGQSSAGDKDVHFRNVRRRRCSQSSLPMRPPSSTLAKTADLGCPATTPRTVGSAHTLRLLPGPVQPAPEGKYLSWHPGTPAVFTCLLHACKLVNLVNCILYRSRFVFFTKDTHGGGSPALLTKGQCPANVVQAKDRRT